MAVKVKPEECIGCSACVSACSFGAIIMEGDSALITDACTACGACVEICPVGAIMREVEEKNVAMNKEEFKGVWVYVEQTGGQARNVGYELLAEGRKLG